VLSEPFAILLKLRLVELEVWQDRFRLRRRDDDVVPLLQIPEKHSLFDGSRNVGQHECAEQIVSGGIAISIRAPLRD